MKARTIEHGDEAAVVFDRKTLAEEAIAVRVAVSVTTTSGSLMVKASDAEHQSKVGEVTRRNIKENAGALQRLAETSPARVPSTAVAP